MDKKVTFPAGDLTLEGRVWLATGSRDVGVVLCHPHPLRGGNMYSNVVSAVAEALWATRRLDAQVQLSRHGREHWLTW